MKANFNSKAAIKLAQLLLICSILMVSQQSHAQFYNGPMENARSLGKNNFEAAAGFHHYRFSMDDFSGKLSNNFAFRLGYGVGEQADLKFRFERIVPGEGLSGLNYISLTPKVSLPKGNLALSLPFGLLFGEGESVFILSPTLMYTGRVNQNFDISLSSTANIPTENTNVRVDFNLGFGISKDVDKWAVRPELGIHFNPGLNGFIWHLGLGGTVNIGRMKEAGQ